ncbi:MAG: hypothetical protein HQ494_05880 [Rhodospirillales bacterium]|nr:hypothetical protein [Rhodospirillales bacterium]
MYISTVCPEISDQMSHAVGIRPGNANLYPLRIVARVFAWLGLATVVYGLALIIIAFESGIIEL